MNSSDALSATASGEHSHSPRPLTIGIFFDFICPRCLIGMRNLSVALHEFTRLRPELGTLVHWRSHPLLPDTPVGGIPYAGVPHFNKKMLREQAH